MLDEISDVLTSPPWMRDALCADADPDIFFTVDDDDPDVFFAAEEDKPVVRRLINAARAEQAARMCARCPVRAQCLLWALENDDPWAILGGRTAQQRKYVQTRMARRAGERPVRIRGVQEVQGQS